MDQDMLIFPAWGQCFIFSFSDLALGCLQCFSTVGWMTGKHPVKIPMPFIPNVFLSEESMATGHPRITRKWPLKRSLCMLLSAGVQVT